MKRKKINLINLSALIVVSLALSGGPALAQNGNVKTNSKILYHNGPVMQGSSNVYFILYGCWNCGYPGSNFATVGILSDLVINLGGTPYFLINTLYPDGAGGAPNSDLIYSATGYDAYSHGASLTVSDIQGVIANQLYTGGLPLDGRGIYIVIASADVTDIHPLPDGSSTTFCTPNTFPHHGTFEFNGATVKYGFLGNAARCPSSAASQFFATDGTQLPTPNNNLAADAMASTLAHLLDVIVTNPLGTGGWYDRYGLENAQKCQGTFGQTYPLPKGARANMQLGQRHFLIQQNWVNAPHKGYCGLSNP